MSGAARRVLRGALAGAARHAPARVFALVGVDAPGAVDDLRPGDATWLVDSPRSANVLLVAGRLPDALHEPAARVHDAMSHPRATVWWTRGPTADATAAPFPNVTVVGPGEDLSAVLQRVQQELLAGRRASEGALLPDVDPAPWRGVGPYGQGGTGMTGGVPYGRPLADRAEDRDGLMLDQLPVRVGPFFPPFPPGLVLDVKLQGDVVQEATVAANPFVESAGAGRAMDAAAMRAAASRDPFWRALAHPVAIAELEVARAAHHLRWLAHALRVHGLDALGRRTLALAVGLARGESPASARLGVAADVAALARLLERTRALGWATDGVGVTAVERVTDCGLGPVARAAGVADDARLDDEAYRALGFEPVVSLAGHGDARARWRQRLAEAVHSLQLAARAGDQQAGRQHVVEAPRGRLTLNAAPSSTLLALVPELLRDQEWGDAVTTLVSLDVDVMEAAATTHAHEHGAHDHLGDAG